MTSEEYQEFLSIREKAGLKIDPATAEVWWCYVPILDPYGLGLDIPEEYRQVGRGYFARSPESDVWVHFGELPCATRDLLREKQRAAAP